MFWEEVVAAGKAVLTLNITPLFAAASLMVAFQGFVLCREKRSFWIKLSSSLYFIMAIGMLAGHLLIQPQCGFCGKETNTTYCTDCGSAVNPITENFITVNDCSSSYCGDCGLPMYLHEG